MALVKKRFDLRKIIHRSYVIPDHVIVERHPVFGLKKCSSVKLRPRLDKPILHFSGGNCGDYVRKGDENRNGNMFKL